MAGSAVPLHVCVELDVCWGWGVEGAGGGCRMLLLSIYCWMQIKRMTRRRNTFELKSIS
jgi:hypothetical protein